MGGGVAQSAGFGFAFALTVVMEVVALLLVVGRVREPAAHTRPRTDTGTTPWRALLPPSRWRLRGILHAAGGHGHPLGVVGDLAARPGGSDTYIGLTMTVFALPQIFLGAFAGRVGDRWGRAPLLLGGGLLVGVVYASYGFMTNLTLIVIVGVLEGIFIVVQRPAAQSLLADGAPAWARGRAQVSPGRPARLEAPSRRLPRSRCTTRHVRSRSCSPGW